MYSEHSIMLNVLLSHLKMIHIICTSQTDPVFLSVPSEIIDNIPFLPMLYDEY